MKLFASISRDISKQEAKYVTIKFFKMIYLPSRFLKESKRIISKGKMIVNRIKRHNEVKRTFLEDFNKQWKDMIYKIRVKEANYNLKLLGDEPFSYEYIEGIAKFIFEEKLIQLMKTKPWAQKKSTKSSFVTDIELDQKNMTKEPTFRIEVLESLHRSCRGEFNYQTVISGIEWKKKKILETTKVLHERKTRTATAFIQKKEKQKTGRNKLIMKMFKKKKRGAGRKTKSEKRKKKKALTEKAPEKKEVAIKPRQSVQQKLEAIKSFGALVKQPEKLKYRPDPIELEALILISVEYYQGLINLRMKNKLAEENL